MMRLKYENDVISLSFGGCRGAGKPGHREIVQYEEPFRPTRSSPITRLFLHAAFGRKYKLDKILDDYDKYFKDGKHQDENFVDVFKRLILEDHEQDPTWKICPACKMEYANGKRSWQHILYVTPTTAACEDHASKT